MSAPQPVWQVDFTSEAEKWKLFTAACHGNEKKAKVLEAIVCAASYEAMSQGLDKSCNSVVITRSFTKMSDRFNFRITEKTYLEYRKEFRKLGYISYDRHGRETTVNLEPIREAFVNPPVREPKPRNQSCSKKNSTGLQDVPETVLKRLQDCEQRLQDYDKLLAQKTVELQDITVALQEKTVLLQDYHRNVTGLQDRISQLEARLEEHFSQPPMISNDISMITNDKGTYNASASATHRPLSELSEDELLELQEAILDHQDHIVRKKREMAENAIETTLAADSQLSSVTTPPGATHAIPQQASLLDELSTPPMAQATERNDYSAPAFTATSEKAIEREQHATTSDSRDVLPVSTDHVVHCRIAVTAQNVSQGGSRAIEETHTRTEGVLNGTEDHSGDMRSSDHLDANLTGSSAGQAITPTTSGGRDRREHDKRTNGSAVTGKDLGPVVMPANDAPWTAETIVQIHEARRGSRYPNGAKRTSVREKALAHAGALLAMAADLWTESTKDNRDFYIQALELREKQDNAWFFEHNGYAMPHHMVKDDRIHTVAAQLKRQQKKPAVVSSAQLTPAQIAEKAARQEQARKMQEEWVAKHRARTALLVPPKGGQVHVAR
jgi:hypothetical protein